MGLNQRDINITDEGNKLVLEFEWKHPLSEKKLRRIEYNHSSTMKSTKIPKINCFYQKSLENYNLNIVYSSLIKDKIDENGCAFFGYWHSETEDKNNSLLREEYKNILGKSFNEIPEIELANLIEKLKIIGNYGNRLHCFKRI